MFRDQPYAGYPNQPRGHWGGQNQHDRGERRGRRDRGDRFPPAAHNPYEVRLPKHIESIATCEDDDRKISIIMVDTREERIVSPFQAWLVREIMTNSSRSINFLTERDQVMPPSPGSTSRSLLHAAWDQGDTGDLSGLDHRRSLWRLVCSDLPRHSPMRLSAFLVASAPRHFAIVHRHQGVQWQ